MALDLIDGFDAAKNKALQLYKNFQVECDETHAIQTRIKDLAIQDAKRNLEMAQSRLSALEKGFPEATDMLHQTHSNMSGQIGLRIHVALVIHSSPMYE